MFLLCFAVLVAATSAASVCKCEDKKVHFEAVSFYYSTIKKNCFYEIGFNSDLSHVISVQRK